MQEVEETGNQNLAEVNLQVDHMEVGQMEMDAPNPLGASAVKDDSVVVASSPSQVNEPMDSWKNGGVM